MFFSCGWLTLGPRAHTHTLAVKGGRGTSRFTEVSGISRLYLSRVTSRSLFLTVFQIFIERENRPVSLGVWRGSGKRKTDGRDEWKQRRRSPLVWDCDPDAAVDGTSRPCRAFWPSRQIIHDGVPAIPRRQASVRVNGGFNRCVENVLETSPLWQAR